MQQEPLETALRSALGTQRPSRLGVAVSGGGDSLALLHLLAGIYRRDGGILEAVTVDHALRDGSAAEAEQVAALCAGLGVPHKILRWEGWGGAGNLQDAARQARYRLMGAWAQVRGLEAVALGHTADDQAETVLLRLARRSGVDGLAGMARARHDSGVLWLRPLLDVRRAALRDYLTENDIAWVDDPSNDDLRFDRIKARRALASLADIGIDAAALGVVAANMAEASEALESYARLAAEACVQLRDGAVVISRAGLAGYPAEVQRRLLARALDWIAPAPYPPRRAGLAQLMQALARAEAATLGGCALVCRKDEGWLFRELNVVATHVTSQRAAWDGRWHCTPAEECSMAEQMELRALSANGLKQCDNWRDLGLPRGVLLSHPGLWHGDTLVSSPVAKTSPNWRWHMVRGEKALFQPAL